MDQVLAVRQVCNKYHDKGKYVFLALMDFEKTYDTIDRHGTRQMSSLYGVGGMLLEAVNIFYVDSRACVRVGEDVSEWFPV